MRIAARAAGYDQWCWRQGRFDRGGELNVAWFDDVAVPIDRLDAFWVALTDALRLEGSVYVIDSAHDPTSTAVNHLLPDAVARVATQKLDDGSTYRIVKHFWAPSRLTQALANIGWRANLRQTRRYFIYGAAVRE